MNTPPDVAREVADQIIRSAFVKRDDQGLLIVIPEQLRAQIIFALVQARLDALEEAAKIVERYPVWGGIIPINKCADCVKSAREVLAAAIHSASAEGGK